MELSEMLLNGANSVEIIPVDVEAAAINSEYFQADASTNFGLLITQSGGVISNGVVRLLGSNRDPNYRDINLFNIKFGSGRGFIILGDDIFGGIFAVNTGLFPEFVGNIMYFAPDTLDWEDMEIRMSGFLAWLRDGDMAEYYGQFSEEEYEALRARNVPFNKVLSIVPPQWSAEFNTNPHDVREIDINEHYKLTLG
ncbi:MAG: DUF2625 domain-containing protein [Oscillospiraceae bacterium]|nr:DUF2625 domain-containing protein [Oscillospiraceae bacterium]